MPYTTGDGDESNASRPLAKLRERALTATCGKLPSRCIHSLALTNENQGAYAIELSKPSLCWIMTSNAVSLCQSLGYHRYSTMKDDTEEQRAAKVHAFWFIYMLDKNLSLRLGRASSFQDWDMSLREYLQSQSWKPP